MHTFLYANTDIYFYVYAHRVNDEIIRKPMNIEYVNPFLKI